MAGIFRRRDGLDEPVNPDIWGGETCDGCSSTGKSADIRTNSSGDRMCYVCRESGLG